MKKLRAIFVGTVEFSLFALEKILSLSQYVSVEGVITKKESKFNSDFADLTPICNKFSIPIKYVYNINEAENVEWIKRKKPDVIFVFGWSQLIKKPILEIPKIGVIGFHPAKLPQNRGRHPIIWALVLGLEETASTFFFIDEGTDSGDILSQKVIKIAYEDTARTLYNKVIQTALKQIEEFIPKLSTGDFERIPQDHSKANYWRKRTEKDGEIDFRMSSRAIYNLIRALTRPYVGAHFIYKGEKIKVWKAKEETVKMPNIEPGKVLKVEERKILVKCYDNGIWLEEHELKKLPSVGEYLC